jgi:hypothetical protein
MLLIGNKKLAILVLMDGGCDPVRNANTSRNGYEATRRAA